MDRLRNFAGQPTPQDKKPSLEIGALSKTCQEAEGYVVLVGIVTKDKDPLGNNILDFHYLREHCPLEDAKQALSAMKKHIMNDLVEGMDGIV